MIFNHLRFLIISIFIINGAALIGQTTIFSDAGPYSYTGIDVPATENFSADVSNCTSVSISFNYSFSLPWEGSGNMETCDECPGCGCDPENGIAGGCTPCWDFLYGVMQLDGSTVFSDLIGDTGTTDLQQSGTMSSGFICTDGASTVDLDITTNTWAGDETSTFSTIVITCYEATASDILLDSDLCVGQDVNLQGVAWVDNDVDEWSWSTDGGSVIDDDTEQITFATGAVDGETYTLTTTDVNGCSTSVSETVSLSTVGTASIDQTSNGELCFGDCSTISFNFSGGVEPYDLDLSFTISGVGFPINFNAPGFAANDVITVCYDIGGIFPAYDPGDQTISVPEIAGGLSGQFLLNGFTDDNGCQGTVGGMGFSLAFLESPDANFAFLEECDEGGGMATFDLTEMDNDVNGGSGNTVMYYDDISLTTEIFSPYVSPSSVIYATVTDANCTSEPVEVDIIVIDNGDAGTVELYCTDLGTTECIICDDDGILGQAIQILFVFNDPSLPHDIVLSVTDDNGNTQTTYNLAGNQTNLTITISSNTTVELLSVTEGDGCADTSDLGDIVNITYNLAPDLDPIGPLSDCGSLVLPDINGTDLTGSEMYYTMPNEGGTSYAVGEVITESIDLYVYSGNPDCFDEILVEVEILPGTTFDQPMDTTSCGPYMLPEITGTGVQSSATYYTLPNGNGNIYIAGNLVLSTTTLYIYDPSSSCSSNEPSFTITVNTQPEINEIEDVDTCGIYELPTITGAMLTSDQAYFTEPNGMGIELMAGDTIFASDTIYAFDNNAGCIAEIEVEIIIDEGPTAGVGDTISICATGTQILNLPALLTVPADTLGMWSDDMGIILDDTDSTMVDVTGLIGEINFMYVIENMVCGNDTSHLQVNLQQQLDAGGGEDTFLACEFEIDNFNLSLFWDVTGVNDTIIFPMETAMTLSGTTVGIGDLEAGSYFIQYIVGVNDTICLPDTANLEVLINPLPDAGENVNTSTCLGNIIDLSDLLVNNNQIGTFADPGMTGALFGDQVDSGVLGEGTFIFTHSVEGTIYCPPETIEISITVTNDVSAGVSVLDTICYTEEINLFDYLDGASAGGIFQDADNANQDIPDGIRIVDTWPSLPAGTPILTTSIYTVGDGIDCPISSSTIELLVLPEPEISLEVLQYSICNDILDLEIDYTYLEDFDFTLLLDGPLAELPIEIPFTNITPPLPASDELVLQVLLDSFNLPSEIEYTISLISVTRGECVTEIMGVPQPFIIGQQDTLLVNDIICGNESVTYNGMDYNASNPSDLITIPRPGMCDSIIMIDLNIAQDATSLINNELCTGQSITVGGTVYDENNPSGEFILFDGAANGCDSTVVIELTFGDASINDIVQDICSGEVLIINGITYDENNLMNSDTIFGGSIGGCDSIINVNLTPISPTIGSIIETTCNPTFSITINGMVYDFNTQSGMETIVGGASNGCDSLVNIELTFLDPATGIEDGTICSGETIEVNGTTYGESLLTGTETFIGAATNGCDSIVTINLTFLDTAEGDFINSSCDELYSITINGNIYDISNTEGTELIAGGAANGCDSIANIMLSFDGIVADTELIQPDCNNDQGQLIINNITGVAPFYYLEASDLLVEISSFPYIIANLEGDGTVTLQDVDGCQTEVTYSIMAFTPVTLSSEVINNQITISGISSDAINSIEWTPSLGLSCTDCLNPTFVVTEDTEYLVTINYGTDCTAEVIVQVSAEEIPIVPDYYIPNVFSPNGDGNNDVFYITPNSGGSNTIASMTIFDRWGNQMFRRVNYLTETNEGWDGTFNGGEVNPGVYIYVIEVLERETIKPIYGDITIVK